jgi:GT2 family glycosyltransferase
VIVNYRQWENTATLVRQLLTCVAARSGVIEMVVVDNHSPFHPLASRLRRWRGVSLRRWSENRGFARAVNEGARLSRANWLLLLNPDLTITGGFLEGVLALADRLTREEPRTGIVGFHLRNRDGTRQLSCGALPTLGSTLTGLALPRRRRKYRAFPSEERCRVPWVTGCCLLIRRACFEQLGGMAEDFFLYYEDVDLCRRARQMGWHVWHEPELIAVHYTPLHDRPVSPTLRAITRHSLLTYAARHWPRWQFRLLAGIVRLEAWGRRIWAAWRGAARAAAIFEQMGKLARELSVGNSLRARRRLHRLIERGEEELGA